MSLGIMGGTFDPPHNGHLALARSAYEQCGLDEVILIPARQPPHKSRPDMSPVEDRLNMTQAFAESEQYFTVSDIEIKRSGPSFTVDTLRDLAKVYPGRELHIIIGEDMVRDFATWRAAEEIINLAPPLWAQRPGVQLQSDPYNDFPGLARESVDRLLSGRFEMSPADISSTEIRAMCAEGKDVSALLPPKVLEYLREKGLYTNR